MTSLIDVIFLLLLFFMLSSTFTRFSELQLTGGAASAAPATGAPPVFLRLGPEALRLNGAEVAMTDLPARLADLAEPGAALLVQPGQGTSAQRLVDLMVALAGIETPKLAVRVLE
ncbi:biopolymer transporter ExbD [Mesobaculum littorinae]|uniref:Biopolymer transporter ExbD n=1 Tax=Mesobaculum littorinae TaxID=2486419 RepID=A0A438AIN6_9RHOB|nr:biopolymer transporter ExbD [Mesobaculum littorinae]